MVLREDASAFEESYAEAKGKYETLWKQYLTGAVDRRMVSQCNDLTAKLFDTAVERADLEKARELSDMITNIKDMMKEKPAECSLAAYAGQKRTEARKI